MNRDIIVVDTEGSHVISEIAIIDSQGELVYEAYNEEVGDRYEQIYNLLPLQQILQDFTNIAQDKLIICHHAKHDREVIQRSFIHTGMSQPQLCFDCTYLLAKHRLPSFTGYSLEHLSNELHLQVNKRYFNPQQAHAARYDAAFTYELYRYLTQQPATPMNQPNPFYSSRVDNPFQKHPDLASINQEQFQLLTSIVEDIKYDPNHQSKGAVVIGSPGSGKTHLMMRLANELLENNRLLFIRQPNNADTIIYHTYSRILESLIEKVTQSYTQIEYLLARSFTQIINSQPPESLTQKDKYIINNTQQNNLNLYPALGIEGSAKKREYWQHIEKRTSEWWLNSYGAAGYSLEIIKGIIKFCSYSDPLYKRLVTRWLAADTLDPESAVKIGLNNWHEEISKNAFSLEAIGVLGKLSLLDKPLIIIFDQLEGLGLEHNRQILLEFGEAIKEIFTHVPNSLIILNLFPDRWEQFQQIFDGSIIDRVSQHQVWLEKPSPQRLQEIIRLKAQTIGIDIASIFTQQQLTEITSQKSIRAALNKADSFYRARGTGKTQPIANSQSTTDSRIETLEKQVSQLHQLFTTIAEAFSTFQAGSQNVESISNKEVDSKIGNVQNTPDREIVSKVNNAEEQAIIDYIEKQKAQIEAKYNRVQIIDDNDDIGKLKTIVNAFNAVKKNPTEHLRLGKKKLPQHLVIKTSDRNLCLSFLQISGSTFTNRIKNFNSLVINYQDIQFVLIRDSRLPAHSGKVGNEEILKLKNAANGSYWTFNKDNRITFELIYQLIIDLQNKDLDLEIGKAMDTIKYYFANYWLVKILTQKVST